MILNDKERKLITFFRASIEPFKKTLSEQAEAYYKASQNINRLESSQDKKRRRA